jgi:hypothetical protein
VVADLELVAGTDADAGHEQFPHATGT